MEWVAVGHHLELVQREARAYRAAGATFRSPTLVTKALLPRTASTCPSAVKLIQTRRVAILLLTAIHDPRRRRTPRAALARPALRAHPAARRSARARRRRPPRAPAPRASCPGPRVAAGRMTCTHRLQDSRDSRRQGLIREIPHTAQISAQVLKNFL